VTSTLADGTPGVTGLLSAPTSSTMHRSVLNTVLKDGSLGKRIPDYHWWDNRSTGPVTYSELPHVVGSALLSYNTENAKPLITPATTIAAANIR
jgi:hypothetical protein